MQCTYGSLKGETNMTQKTMQALVYRGEGKIGIEERPVPTLREDASFPLKYDKSRTITIPRRDLVTVKVEAASICGTDLHILEGLHDSEPPVILGHEFIGRVERVGKNVTHLASGDRIAVDPNIKCGECQYCENEMSNQCTDLTTLGIFCDGGFAEYCLVPAKQLFKIPETSQVSHDRMMLVEPLSCVLHGLGKLDVQPTDRVLIFGAGPIGYYFTALCNSAAGEGLVCVFEPEPARRSFIETMGGTAIDLQDVKEGSFDVVIDASGNPNVVPEMIGFAAIGARLLLFGQQNIKAKIEIPPTAINQKELVVLGSYAATSYSFEQAIKVLTEMPIFGQLVSHRAYLNDVPRMFQEMRKRPIRKAIISPQGGIQ